MSVLLHWLGFERSGWWKKFRAARSAARWIFSTSHFVQTPINATALTFNPYIYIQINFPTNCSLPFWVLFTSKSSYYSWVETQQTEQPHSYRLYQRIFRKQNLTLVIFFFFEIFLGRNLYHLRRSKTWTWVSIHFCVQEFPFIFVFGWFNVSVGSEMAIANVGDRLLEAVAFSSQTFIGFYLVLEEWCRDYNTVISGLARCK